MMRTPLTTMALLLITLVAMAIGSSAAHAADRVTKETLVVGSQTRHYYLFVPASVGTDAAPLLIVLHGSGRDGRSLVEPWSDLAERALHRRGSC